MTERLGIKHLGLVVSIALLLLLSACSSGNGPDPGFNLSLTPDALELVQSDSGAVSITVTRTGGFSGAVEVTLLNPPSGISANPLTLSGSEGNLTLNAALSAAESVHALTVQGSSGSLTDTALLSLTVVPQGGADTASLTVAIEVDSSAPSSVTAEVVIEGPGGYSKPLSSSETLTELEPGTYILSAKRWDVEPVPGAKVGASYGDGRGVIALDLEAGDEEEVSITYALHAGSGKLWVSNNLSGTVSGYDQTDLSVNGSPDPAVTLEVPFSRPYALAIDATGRLWSARGGSTNELVAYAPEQLAGTGDDEPAVTISSSGALKDPRGLAFDAAGNLWVSNWGNDTLIRYNASQLATSGDPVPAVILSSAAIDVKPYSTLAFDGEGGLWVTGGDGPEGSNSGTLIKFSADQLVASGNITPAVTLYSSQGNAPQSIFGGGPFAFDQEGNLWVVSGIDGIWKFGAADLAVGGDLTPEVIIRNTGGGIVNQTGGSLAFDAQGNLWVAKLFNSSNLLMYSPAQLAGSGVIDGTPSVQISGNALSNPFGLAFYPPPPGYPLE